MGWKIAVILMAHVEVVGEKTAHTEYPSISLAEAIDSINAKLKRKIKALCHYSFESWDTGLSPGYSGRNTPPCKTTTQQKVRIFPTL